MSFFSQIFNDLLEKPETTHALLIGAAMSGSVSFFLPLPYLPAFGMGSVLTSYLTLTLVKKINDLATNANEAVIMSKTVLKNANTVILKTNKLVTTATTALDDINLILLEEDPEGALNKSECNARVLVGELHTFLDTTNTTLTKLGTKVEAITTDVHQAVGSVNSGMNTLSTLSTPVTLVARGSSAVGSAVGSAANACLNYWWRLRASTTPDEVTALPAPAAPAPAALPTPGR